MINIKEGSEHPCGVQGKNMVIKHISKGNMYQTLII